MRRNVSVRPDRDHRPEEPRGDPEAVSLRLFQAASESREEAHSTPLPRRFLPHLLFAIPRSRVEVPVTVALRYGVAVCHERREGDSSNVWVLRDPLAPDRSLNKATVARPC